MKRELPTPGPDYPRGTLDDPALDPVIRRRIVKAFAALVVAAYLDEHPELKAPETTVDDPAQGSGK